MFYNMAASGAKRSNYKPKGASTTYSIVKKSGESTRQAVARYKRNGYSF